jgi:prolyl-tRNA synthetase
LIGGVIMAHGDDDGIILPPRVASAHAVILPIIRKPADRNPVMTFVDQLAAELRAQSYHQRKVRIEIDDRDIGGARNWDWIKKGIPLRIEVGPRDIAANSVFVARRDRRHQEKASIGRETFVGEFAGMLDRIQENLFQRALAFREEHTRGIEEREAFYRYFTPQDSQNPEIHGGFAVSPWCGSESCEAKIKEDLGVTVRCIPFESEIEDTPCVCCGSAKSRRVVFAKAY